MSFYVAQLLEGEEVEVVASPTTKTTYNVDEKVQSLGDEERKWFHSKTAKLLYLSKRARLDILTAVIFFMY
jgi:ClpP class serine protease